MLSPPFSAEGGVAVASSFLFFAEGSGLANQGQTAGGSSISKNKTKLKHLLVHRSVVDPPLGELEAREPQGLRYGRAGSRSRNWGGGGTRSGTSRC